MRKKKAIWMALLLVVIMLFAACGGKDDAPVSGKVTPAGTEQKSEETEQSTSTEAVEDEEAATPTEAVEDENTTGDNDATENLGADDETKDTEETGKMTSLGRVQGGTYVNEYVGVSCTLDENWTFFTAEELQELPENVKEMFEGTVSEDQMSALNYITDMSAENLEQLTSMNIVYQKMSFYEHATFKGMSHSEVVDKVLTQKDVMINTYAQAGINVSELGKKTISFCGEEREVLYMVSEYSGVPYYTIQILNYNLGDYSATVTLASFVEDKTEALATLFSKYE